jgi:hypothetical protein
MMTITEIKEQLQQDILVILESYGVDEAMEGRDYNNMVTNICDAVIFNLNKFSKGRE